MHKQYFAGAFCALALTACATAEAPTMTADEVFAEQVEIARLNEVSVTALGDMPTSGSASFTGTADGTFTPGSAVDGFIADVTVTANFSDNTIDGSVTNMNAIEAGLPDQLVRGTLDIDGTIDGNAVSGMATGTITAVDDGFRGSADANFAFDGSFRDDAGTADAIAGSVTGRADGDFSVVVQEGGFYVKQ